MKDLTTGSIPKHLMRLALPMMAGMVFQTLYHFVDLWFVSALGDAAIAGVSSAGTIQFIIMAATQVLGVGTTVLIAHAAGRKDRADATLVFNQSIGLAAVFALSVLVLGGLLVGPFVRGIGADAATEAAGRSFLYFVIPGLALQFPMIAMGSALRGTGVVKPMMLVQIGTVVLNALLAPVLIAGWGTGRPLGVAGAGLATTLAVLTGVFATSWYFARLEKFVGFDRTLIKPKLAVWKRLLAIGIPAGGEFALMFIYMTVTYWIIRDFGAVAQAGFGVGSRVMQGLFVPIMAVAISVAPLAGQNLAAGHIDRVRASFKSAALMSSALMFAMTLFVQWRPDLMIRIFTHETEVIAVGATFLSYASWNFVASGLIFACSSMFQALGNTVPALLSGATRLVTYAIPAIWLSRQGNFALTSLWRLGVATVTLQLLVSALFLRREYGRRLPAYARGTGTLRT